MLAISYKSGVQPTCSATCTICRAEAFLGHLNLWYLQWKISINADVIITDSSDSRSHRAGQWLGIYWVSFPDCTHCITVTGWIFDSAGLLPLQRLSDYRTEELLKLSLLSSRQAAIEPQCRTAAEQGVRVRRHCWAQVSESWDKADGKWALDAAQGFE